MGVASALGPLMGPQVPKGRGTPASRAESRPGLPLQGTAKSAHPDYVQLKVYVRGATKKAAWRKWEDAGGGDMSDLLEALLQKYLGSDDPKYLSAVVPKNRGAR